jgi:hypothetical protein
MRRIITSSYQCINKNALTTSIVVSTITLVNITKHGVSLGLAVELEWDTLWVRQDSRRNYGEGLIISLRKANLREVRFYANNH